MAEEIVAIYRAEVEGYKQQVDQLVGKVDALTAAQGKAQAASTNLGKSALNTGKQIAAAFGVTAGIVGFVSVLKSGISTAKNFEEQMSKVRAITRATNEDMTRLERSAKKLGSTTEFTATQVGQLQEEYARLGFTTKEILAATEATLNLATATGATLAEAAEVAGSTVRGFELSASETVRVTDVMAESFSRTSLNISRFRESMKMVAPIANSANISIELTTALLGQLANVGIHGSMAGTALKNLLSQLSDANSELSKEVGFAVKNNEDLIRAFEILATKNIDLTKATELTDQRSKAAFLTLFRGIKTVTDLEKALDNATGATKRMADVMRDNLAKDIDGLASAWEGLTLQLGNTSVLRSATQFLTKWLQTTKKILQSSSELIGEAEDEQRDSAQRTAAALTAKISKIAEEQEKIEKLNDEIEFHAKKVTEATSAINEYTRDGTLAPTTEAGRLKLSSLNQQLIYHQEHILALTELQDALNEKKKKEEPVLTAQIRNIELLSSQLKGLKEELEKAEIGSANFFAVLDKVNAKIKELQDAEAMTKLAEALIPDAEEMMSVSEAYINELARMAQADADLAAKRTAATDKEMAAFEELLNVRIRLMGDTEQAEIDAIRLATQRKLAEYSSNAPAEIELRAAIEQDAQMQIDAVRKAWEEKAAADRLARLDTELQETQQYIGAVGNLYASFSALQEAASNRELAALQNRLDQGLISEEQYDQERRKIARKQAADAKQAAVAQAIMNTAMAVTQALASAKPPLNFALAALVGAAGAIQVAAIIAEPLPQFEHGGVVKEDGRMVGRRHSQGGILIEAEGGEHITRRKYASEWGDLLESVNKGAGMDYINKHFVAPAVSEAMLKGMDDIGTSAALNGLMTGFSDMNLLSAIDRHRETEVAALMRIEKALTRQTTPDRKRWN